MLVTKFGLELGRADNQRILNSWPENFRKVTEDSLERLRIEASNIASTTRAACT